MALMINGYGGEGVAVARQTRLTDDAVRRVRARQMLVMRLQGQSVAEIAVYFSFTRQFVYREINDIPDPEKRRITGGFHRGQVA